MMTSQPDNVVTIAEKQKIKPFRRPITEILEDLQKPIPKRLLKNKRLKGNDIAYLPWYTYIKLLDYYAPGFDWKVDTKFCSDRYQAEDGKEVVRARTIVEGTLTIKAAEGDFVRSATGTEENDVDSYGDPSSNAEAMALRRCCAKFGLGLHLWEK